MKDDYRNPRTKSHSPELGWWLWEWKGDAAFGVSYGKQERGRRQRLSVWGFE